MGWRDAIGVLKDVLPQDMQSEEIIWCSRNGWSYDDYRAMKRLGVDPRDYASPIGAFVDALLSDEVVEAAAREAVHCEGDDWKRVVTDSPTVADAHIQVARRQLQAAITAVQQAKEVGNE